jgi:hypothetical protein
MLAFPMAWLRGSNILDKINRRQGMSVILAWFRRQLADPQIVSLTLIVLLLALSVWMFGQMLAPLLVSLVIAYLELTQKSGADFYSTRKKFHFEVN